MGLMMLYSRTACWCCSVGVTDKRRAGKRSEYKLREGRGQIEKRQQSSISQPFRATVRYCRIYQVLLPRFATLIGQLSLVPVFGTNSLRYIIPALFRSAVIVF